MKGDSNVAVSSNIAKNCLKCVNCCALSYLVKATITLSQQAENAWELIPNQLSICIKMDSPSLAWSINC